MTASHRERTRVARTAARALLALYNATLRRLRLFNLITGTLLCVLIAVAFVVPHDQSQTGLDLVNGEAAAAIGLLDASATTIEDMVALLGYVKHGESEALGPHQ